MLHEDLLTIDMETVATLREEEEGSTVPPAQATQESTLMPATPVSATNRNSGQRRGDKDLCHSKEGAGGPVGTQERE